MMVSTPLISIVIATYNSAAVLQACLNSVAKQSSKRFEVIVVDGGSKDDTIEIIKRNGDIITLWISEGDTGIYDAWNKGIKLANCEWVMFVGSDDLLHPTAISDYADFIGQIKAGEIEFISGNVNLVSSKGKIIKHLGAPWNWKIFKRYMNIAHVASLHSKKYFEKYGLFNTNYKIAGDYELLLRSGANLKAGYLNKVVASMAHGGVSSGNSKVFNEALSAKRYSGKVNVFVCYYDDIVARVKFAVKNIIGYGK